MNRHLVIWAPMVVLAVAASCSSQEDSVTPKLTNGINAPIPATFKLVDVHQSAGVNHKEYMRLGQTTESWTDMITIQELSSTLPAVDFYHELGEGMKSHCQTFAMEKGIRRIGLGYNIVRGAFYCGKANYTGLGEFTNVSVASKNGKIHILQRAVRTQPYDAATGKPPIEIGTLLEWKDFFFQDTTLRNRC